MMNRMTKIELTKLPNAPFGTLVRGLSHASCTDTEVAEQLAIALMETSLLVCEDIEITPEQHCDLGRMFGELSQLSGGDGTRVLDGASREIFVVSNMVDSNGQPVGTYGEKDIWHADHAYRRIPSIGSLFYPRKLPQSPLVNQTSFCSTVDAHRLLPDALFRQLRTAQLFHDHEWYDKRYYPDSTYDPENRIKYPLQAHPIFRKMDNSESICMFLSGTTGRYIVDSDGRRLEHDFVEELIERITPPERVYTHHYLPNQLVIWSNFTALHKPRPALTKDQLVSEDHPNARLMHRVAVKGKQPVFPAFG